MQKISEILNNFKYIKMQIWEKLFLKKTTTIRKKEKHEFIKYGSGLGLMAVGSGGHLLSIYVTIMLVHTVYHRPLTI